MPPAKKQAAKTATPPDKLRAAADFEEALRQRAENVWSANPSSAGGLTEGILAQLYPILREPIPEGYIETIPSVTGKPYDSTGIRSVQVQHDRMNNVLGPIWWHESIEYQEEGKLCRVTVAVIDKDGEIMVARESWGGVDRGSTLGNVYKGSYTNAAKVAFARLGPGHEIYVGAADLDPDVSQSAAEQQAKTDDVKPLDSVSSEDAQLIRDQFDKVVLQTRPDTPERDAFMDAFRMKCGELGIAGGKWHLLTPSQAAALSGWLAEQETT